MSGVCPDCPGAYGCCVTANRFDDDDDLDKRDWYEWFYEVGLNAVMWTVAICLAFAAAGICFLIGAFCFATGLALFR